MVGGSGRPSKKQNCRSLSQWVDWSRACVSGRANGRKWEAGRQAGRQTDRRAKRRRCGNFATLLLSHKGCRDVERRGVIYYLPSKIGLVHDWRGAVVPKAGKGLRRLGSMVGRRREMCVIDLRQGAGARDSRSVQTPAVGERSPRMYNANHIHKYHLDLTVLTWQQYQRYG